MMRSTPKLSFLIYLSAILMSLAMFIGGCASPPSPPQTTPAPTEVRQPKGNPETFWNKIGWSDLTPAEQNLWGKLGWDKNSWEGKAPVPPSENTDWGELSPAQRKAAEQLGYDRFYWDSN